MMALPAQTPRSMCATSSSATHLLMVKVVSVISMMLLTLVPSSIAAMIIGIAALMPLRVMAMVARVRMTVVMTRLTPSIAVFAMVVMTLPVAARSADPAAHSPHVQYRRVAIRDYCKSVTNCFRQRFSDVPLPNLPYD